MTLEWKLKLVLMLMKLSGWRPMHEQMPEAVRAREVPPSGRLAALIFGAPRKMAAVEDRLIDGRSGPIPVRVYWPAEERPLPMLVYYHGGGWVVGSIETHDTLCRRLAAESGHLVVAVGYRLAPEHRFPAAVEDAFDALVWAASQAAALGGDGSRLSVAGDSAGGNLAAVVCQLARDAGGPAVRRQVLIYPAVDGSRDYPSAETFAEAPILTRRDMDWFVDLYLSDPAQKTDARFSPLLGALADLPPALIVTAEYDPLRDQGQAYADGLRAAGGRVDYRQYARQVHGFLTLAGIAGQADAAFAEIARFVRG